jgi:CheY-like chemotaxis protein
MSALNQPRPALAILVVDDSADTAESEADLLAFQGHSVRVALNGEDALLCVDAALPDVVLLDIRLPRMDGHAIARRIRERCATAGKQPFIVAVTGCGNEVDREQSSEAGFDLHLVKPVDPAILVGTLERFRRLLAPSIPAAELEPPTEDPPDGQCEPKSFCLGWHPL